MGIFKRHNFEEVTLFNQPAHGACTMIKRECLEILNGYDEDFNCQDGWDLWLRFINKFGVKNINLPLFYYRQHDQNLTKNEDLLLETRSKMIRKVNNKKSDKTKKTIAIIPIRGHSVDTNSLGLRKLGNKLVIDWTIEAALNAKNITNVIITCPDRNLQKYLDQKYGRSVKFFHRNWKLALIHDGLDKTLTDLFNKLPKKMRNFDTICLLSIECPFRKTYSIDMAIDALELFDGGVLGVRQSEDLLFKHKGTGLIPLSQKKYIHRQRTIFINLQVEFLFLKRLLF